MAGAAMRDLPKPVAVKAPRCGSRAAGKLSGRGVGKVTHPPRPCENVAKIIGKSIKSETFPWF